MTCPFCDTQNLASRLIRANQWCISLVSSPWFRPHHCLVIPRRHITRVAELEGSEAQAIMIELGHLAQQLDVGFGSGIMQKYQPLQAENGIKVHHLHFHVFPRHGQESGLFPTPMPNSFAGFATPTDTEAQRLIAYLTSAK